MVRSSSGFHPGSFAVAVFWSYIDGIKINNMNKEQYNIGDEVTYRDRQHLVVDVFPDGEVILVPMDIINSECISVVDEDID
jgi:hypothetical protein